MDLKNPTIDWDLTEKMALGMTDCEISAAIYDIQKTCRFSDELDRKDGGTRGGFYRDQASVYHLELKRREIERDPIYDMYKALKVIAGEPKIRDWLKLGDPQALRQVREAIKKYEDKNGG